MRITYDPKAKAAYIYVDPVIDNWAFRKLGTVDFDDNVKIDVCDQDYVLGIEILDTDLPEVEILG